MLKCEFRKVRVEKQIGIYLVWFTNANILERRWIFRIAFSNYVFDIFSEYSEDKKQEVRMRYVQELYKDKT